MFYSCMANNTKDIDKFEGEIRNLQKEVTGVLGYEELVKFIQRSLDNYMKHRRESFHK